MKKLIISGLFQFRVNWFQLIPLFFLLLVGAFQPAKAEPLPLGYNGHYYRLICDLEGLTWYEARDSAAGMTYNGMQGHLATITSEGEEDFLINSFSLNSTERTEIWLGGSDESSEGTWGWITGETWSYSNWDWDDSEPNGGTNENCLEYKAWVPLWNDENCQSERICFLVEFEPGNGVPADTAIPTLSEWGMIIFCAVAGITAVFYLRRRGSTLM
jgi:hypothetical protein